MSFKEFDGELDSPAGGFVPFAGELDKPSGFVPFAGELDKPEPEPVSSTFTSEMDTGARETPESESLMAPMDGVKASKPTPVSARISRQVDAVGPDDQSYRPGTVVKRPAAPSGTIKGLRDATVLDDIPGVGPVVRGAQAGGAGLAEDLYGGVRGAARAAGLDNVEGWAASSQRAAGQFREETAPSSSGLGDFVQTGVEQTVRTAPGMALGAAYGLPAALGSMAAQTLSGEVGRGLEGGLSLPDAVARAAPLAISEAGTELLPTAGWLRALGGAGKGQLKAYVKNAMIAVGSDVPGEVLNTVIDRLVDVTPVGLNSYGDPLEGLPEDIKKTIYSTVAQGAVMLGLGAGFGAARSATSKPQEPTAADYTRAYGFTSTGTTPSTDSGQQPSVNTAHAAESLLRNAEDAVVLAPETTVDQALAVADASRERPRPLIDAIAGSMQGLRDSVEQTLQAQESTPAEVIPESSQFANREPNLGTSVPNLGTATPGATFQSLPTNPDGLPVVYDSPRYRTLDGQFSAPPQENQRVDGAGRPTDLADVSGQADLGEAGDPTAGAVGYGGQQGVVTNQDVAPGRAPDQQVRPVRAPESKQVSELRRDLGLRIGQRAAANIDLIESTDDPGYQTLKSIAEARGKNVSSIEGYHDPETGRTVVVLPNIKAKYGLSQAERVRWVAFHENLHSGARAKEGSNLLRTLETAASHPAVAKIVQWRKEWMNDGNESRSVEEALVEIGAAIETGRLDSLKARYGAEFDLPAEKGLRKVWDQFVAAVNRTMRSLGIKRDFTGREVLDMLEGWRSASDVELRSNDLSARAEEPETPDAPTGQMFSIADVGKLSNKKNWAVISAEDRNATKQTDEENAAQTAELEARLKADGVKYKKVVGKYGTEQTSFIVYGKKVNERYADALRSEFGQESVLVPEGLLYADGVLDPATGESKEAPEADDYYTMLDGKKWQYGIDFDNRTTLSKYRNPQQESLLSEADDEDAQGEIMRAAKEISARLRYKPLTEETEAANRVLVARVREIIATEMAEDPRSAVWYRENLQEAVALAAEVYPEIGTDPAARSAFIAGLAITSNGLTIAQNVRAAFEVYEAYRETGRMPENEYGVRGKMIAGAQSKFNEFLDAMGAEDFAEFLATPFKAGDLKAMFDVTPGFPVDFEVYGSAIFGPKIGHGFFSNLSGRLDAVTMDRWFFRTWSRLTNTMIRNREDGREILAESKIAAVERAWAHDLIVRAAEEEQAAGNPISPADIQAILWYNEKKLFNEHGAANEAAKPTDYATEVKRHVEAHHPDRLTDGRQEQGRGRGSEAQDWLNGDSKEVAVDEEGIPLFSEYDDASVAGSQQPAVRSRSGSGRSAQDDSVAIVGVHYGQRPDVSRLSGDFNGTGLKGFEAKRLAITTDPRIKRRVYFYIGKPGTGLPRGEHGLGPNVYVAKVDNLWEYGKSANLDYDRTQDADVLNRFESAILDAGYDGYVNRDAAPPMAVVLNADVDVTALGSRITDKIKFSERDEQPDYGDDARRFLNGDEEIDYGEFDLPVADPVKVPEAVGNDIAAVREERPISDAQYRKIGQAWLDIGEDPQTYAFGQSSSQDLAGVMRDLDPTSVVKVITMPADAEDRKYYGNPEAAQNALQAGMGGAFVPSKVYKIRIALSPEQIDALSEGKRAALQRSDGKQWAVAKLYEDKNGNLAVNSSTFQSGVTDGALLYQAIGTWAANNEKVFWGDPAGLSDRALFRRSEQMFTNAVRTRSTSHLRPHADQIEAGLRWKKGDTAYNIGLTAVWLHDTLGLYGPKHYAAAKRLLATPVAGVRVDIEPSAELGPEAVRGGQRTARRVALTAAATADAIGTGRGKRADPASDAERPLLGRLVDQAGPILYSESDVAQERQLSSSRRGFIKAAGALGAWYALPSRAASTKQELPVVIGRGSTDGALAWIEKHGSTEQARALARAIRPLLPKDTPVRIVRTRNGVAASAGAPPQISHAVGVAQINRRDGTLTIFLRKGDGQDGVTEETVLHESVHAAIMARYDLLDYYAGNPGISGSREADAVIAEYTKVYGEFRKMARAEATKADAPVWLKEPYGSPDEFMTWALTNPQFQAYLESKSYNGKTLWQHFKEVVGKILGIDILKNDPSWLDAAVLASGRVLDAAAKDPADFRASRDILKEGSVSRLSSAPVFSEADPVDSPAFKKWFGKSKVVDESGKPMVVYHGTDWPGFDKFEGREAIGWFAEDPAYASQYAGFDRSGVFDQTEGKVEAAPNVVPVYLSIKAPYVSSVDMNDPAVDAIPLAREMGVKNEHLLAYEDGEAWEILGSSEFFDALVRKGYDGLKVKEEGHWTWAPVRHGQIKSVFNRKFDKSPLFSEADPFYSELKRQVEGINARAMTPGDWAVRIKSLKVKPDEITWSGVLDWLQMQQGKVTKDAVVNFLASNGVRIEETMLGEGRYTAKDIERLRREQDSAIQAREDAWKNIERNVPPIAGLKRYQLPIWADVIALNIPAEQNGPGNDRAEDEARKAGLTDEHINYLREYGKAKKAASVALEAYNEAAEDGDIKTQYHAHQLPGGTNYRELLLKLPIGKLNDGLPPAYKLIDEGGGNWSFRGPSVSSGWYKSRERALAAALADAKTEGDAANASFVAPHFGEAGRNLLAHVRFNERTDADGKKVLFIEEIQSDWAQKGRKEGFSTGPDRFDVVNKNSGVASTRGMTREQAERVLAEDSAEFPGQAFEIVPSTIYKSKAAPSAPFVEKTDAWVALLLKRMTKYAADNGFDRVAWTTGEQQAERYDLSKQISKVIATRAKYAPDRYRIRAVATQGGMIDRAYEKSELADAVGKDLADTIVKTAVSPGQDYEFQGLDLKVGGEGMKTFYDRIVPKVANELLKKLGGGKVDSVQLALPRAMQLSGTTAEERAAWQGGKQLGFDVTPELREKAAGGMPLFSEGAQDGWGVDDPSRLDNFIRTMQDKHVDTKRVIAAINQAKGELADDIDVYLKEELYHGRSAHAVHDFLDRELRPLLNDMVLRKVSMDELQQYLWARHAPSRNAAIAVRNPDVQDGGSGMTNAEAREYMQGLDPAKKRALDALAGQVDAILHNTENLLIAYGLESPETIEAWRAQWQHYVPLQREDMDSRGPGTGQGFSVRGPSSKRAKGSERKVVDILANVAMQRERAIVRGEKNRVALALYQLAAENPNPEFWKLAKPRIVDASEAESGEPVKVLSFDYQSKDNVLMARVLRKDGKVHAVGVEFNPRNKRAMEMVTALKNLEAADLGELLGLTAKATRYFAAINTQYNPIFGIVNITRDIQTGLLNLSTTDLAGKQAEVMKNALSAIRGIYTDLRKVRKGQEATSSWAETFERFERAGGKTGYKDMFVTSSERARELQRELKRMKGGKLMQAPRAVFDWLSDYNETLENAVRVGAFKAAIDAGMSDERAASLAKNLTVNFNKKGQVATQAGALYAFFNANVQGTARMIETLKGPTGKKIIAGGLLMGAIQPFLLAAAGIGDGDDDEVPEFIRQRNIIIPIGDKKYVTLPMPLGFHVIPNISRIATEYALSGFKKPGERLTNLLGVFADTFNPIGSAGLSLQTIAPTVIDPFAALAENRDWTGKPIARKDLNSLDATPGHTRAKNTASSFGIAASKAMNWATGGTAHTPGLFSPTPDQIDYLAGQVTGGVGREIGKVDQTVRSLMTGEELPAYKIPLVGRFYGEAAGQESASSRFYENLRDIKLHSRELEGRAKAGEPVRDYIKQYPQATMEKDADRVYREIGEMRTHKAELIKRGADKARVREIDQRMTELMRRFNAIKARAESTK